MGVSEVTMGLGQWSLQLRADTPQSVIDQLSGGWFGHIAITMGRPGPTLLGDGLLSTSRYVGVITRLTLGGSGTGGTSAPKSIGGPGMAFWLGDAEDKGDVLETAVNLTAQPFASIIPLLLPSSGAVTANFISTSVPGTLTQSYRWVSPRSAISSVCSLMGGSGVNAVEWRVNGDATLDAGLVSELYSTAPQVAIVRRSSGADPAMRALRGTIQNAVDVDDYTTRSIVLAGSTPTVGSADLATVPYNDLHGNALKLTRVDTQPSTAAGNATAAAGVNLALYNAPRNAVQLSTDEFDIKGTTLRAGGYVWVQDPDSGLVDITQEIHLRGEILNPVLLRCIQLDWPLLRGHGAAYRDGGGNWTDLTDYLVPESGPSTVWVGATNRKLIGQ